jgi:hypothetical protein
MVEHAANTAAQPNSSRKAPSVASVSFQTHGTACSLPIFVNSLPPSNEAAVGANFLRRDREDDFGASGSLPPRIPSSARGHASGPKPAPCGSASFCFDYVAPAGSRFLPKEV